MVSWNQPCQGAGRRAGAGVWSLAFLVVARLVTWSWEDSRKRAIVTGIAAAVEVGSGTG